MSENDDLSAWRPRTPERPDHPPRRRHPTWAEGENFFALTAKHGRPHGPFERERQLPYRGEG
jgi:hypothetical protein